MYEVVEKRIPVQETSGQSGRCLAAGVSERPAFQISKFVFSEIYAENKIVSADALGG